MTNSILVPLDGSDHSLKALDLAIDLAEKDDTKLVLLHVSPGREDIQELEKYAEVEHMEGPPEWVYEAVIAERIIEKAEQRAKNRGLKSFETSIESGDIAKAILAVAQYSSVDMIVMGTRGLGALQGLAMGSVAHKVVHLAPCTVVLVK